MVTLPFLPFGAFLAGMFLGSTLTVFAFAVHALGRAADRTSGSILPGLVVGFRDWSDRRSGPRIPISPVVGDADGSPDGADPYLDEALDGPVIVELR